MKEHTGANEDISNSPEQLVLGPSSLLLKKPSKHGHTVAFPPDNVVFVLPGHGSHLRFLLYVPLGQSRFRISNQMG